MAAGCDIDLDLGLSEQRRDVNFEDWDAIVIPIPSRH